jgi:hypothetical protein
VSASPLNCKKLGGFFLLNPQCNRIPLKFQALCVARVAQRSYLIDLAILSGKASAARS